MMEFHISREARARYQVKEALFTLSGNVIFGDIASSRELTNSMNRVRDTEQNPDLAVNPGAMFAMGLIDELSHAMVAVYRAHYDPKVIVDGIAWFRERLGQEGFHRLLLGFVADFPGLDIYRGHATPAEWLQQSTGGVSNSAIAFEELVLLWLANVNPAFKPFKELFDDTNLAQSTRYLALTRQFGEYFATRPVFAPFNASLLDVLRAPALASPDSLSGQLSFIRERWAIVLGDILRRLLLALDVLKEEDLAIWMRFHPPSFADIRHGVVATAEVPDFTSAGPWEYERFSQDQEWMPNTVLIAKSTYVWLAQLSRFYGRDIRRLDQIPDEELDILASRGLNALWLIGIWERSRASQTIKRLMGNHDAVASAYSLYDYAIAGDLGGDAAYINLRDRAGRRGIRLASDMVPNHMGIDSRWVIEHPEWFLSRYDSPYPSYRFDGPDLSGDDRVEIKIEDHYFNQSDAAVVLRRRDKWTGDTRYIYHGNDGTSFPWNDTAQLNYLSAAVREQVIQTILHVARLFPIIRFDAAMTLAKRHVQRLWFPTPGSGGAIPSRAESSMTNDEFNALMPTEFWRDVVDRVAEEVPGTLLLAEAFWLMEGYFVRTLGMHRVYNSAFMIMLRDEDNARYRTVLKNTMEFDPDIMKRYVNFMSNPDERTAIDQFGTGDKYFGVATMMATLPGLPMFGHGQVEGFTEKYGMEYRWPRYEEWPSQHLIERHQRQIAPLLHNRALFAESHNFLLYDFWRADGYVDENVFAYSNRRGDERALILYHNHYGETRGTIHTSAAYFDKGTGSLRQQSIADGLALPNDAGLFLAWRETNSGLEYLRRSADLVSNGFTIELKAYGHAILLHWRELRPDAAHPWDRLCDQLQGTGVPNIDEALILLQLKPVHKALESFLDPALVRTFSELAERTLLIAPSAVAQVTTPRESVSALEKAREDMIQTFLRRANSFQLASRSFFPTPIVSSAYPTPSQQILADLLRAAMQIPRLERELRCSWPGEARKVLPSHSPRSSATAVWGPVLAWALLHSCGVTSGAGNSIRPALELFDTLRLRHSLARAFAELGLEGEDCWRAAARVRLLLARQLLAEAQREPVPATPAAKSDTGKAAKPAPPPEAIIWNDADWRWLAGVHEASGHTWIRREPYAEVLWWTQLPALVETALQKSAPPEACAELATQVTRALEAAEAAGYDLDRLIASLPRVPNPSPTTPEPAGEFELGRE